MSGTHAAFFYGTLLRPDIVRNVLKNDGSHLTAAAAILLNHTRLRVAGRDYPAVIQSDKAQAELFGNQLLTPEQRAVQGVLVTGITREDLTFLDDFEGEEYAREEVHVHQVGPGTDLDKLNLSPDSAKLPMGSEPQVLANVYLWTDPCSRLEARTWSYEEFVREKVWRWERKDTAHYTNAAAIDFGHPMKKHFAMAPEWLNLNHGSWGTVPLCVLEYAEKLMREQEAKPDKWFKNGTVSRLAEIRKELATFVNADVEECVLVSNTTHGVNHVLRNFQFNAGDVIVVNHITYGAVQFSAQYFHDIRPHPEVSVLHWTFPLSHDDMVDKFRAHLKSIPRKDSSQRVIAIIDAIASMPGVLMPWERMIQVCKEENVWSLIDAAHAIGQIPLDLHKADPDFLVTNCHKWLYSRRASALFYVPRRNHHIMKSSFPVSWAYRPLAEVKDWTKHFNDQFAADGSNDTSDCVSYLTIAEALRFRQKIGGEKAINSYCHFLALHGGRLAAEILGTTVMDEDGSLTANMVNILLPMPVMPWQTDEDLWARWLEMKVSAIDNNMALQPLFHGGKWWWRASAQVWNELSDFETMANWIKVRCDGYRVADEVEAKARAAAAAQTQEG